MALCVIFTLVGLNQSGEVAAAPIWPEPDLHVMQLPFASPSTSPLFIENLGQFDPQVRFQVQNAIGGTFWLTDEAVWLSLLGPGDDSPLNVRPGVNLKLSFVGSNPQPTLEPFDPQDVPVTYLGRGSEPPPSVPVWGGVRYVDLYPGLDLELFGQENQLVWRLVVRDPLALYQSDLGSLQNIQLQIDGGGTLRLNEAIATALTVETSLGMLTLPLLQIIDVQGQAFDLRQVPPTLDRTRVVAPFTHAAAPPFSLNPRGAEPEAPAPEAAPTPQATAATTSNLRYSTFLGGAGSDCFNHCAITVDAGGSAYVTGFTTSNQFSATAGPFLAGLRGEGDVFVVKLAPDGRTAQYLAFFGGSQPDYGTAIAIDAAGRAHIAGYTSSTDFPATPGAFRTTYGGGFADAFLVELNAAGTAIEYATFFGGENIDKAYALAVDRAGAVYLAGETHSADLPTTEQSIDRAYGGAGDAFVVKFNPAGLGLDFSAFIGGREPDSATGLALDTLNNVYLAGHTRSLDFPTTEGSFDPYHNGLTDGFVLKLAADGRHLDYATLLGGQQNDQANALAVDSVGSVYVTGETISVDFPHTTNAFNKQAAQGYNAFAARLNPAGTQLLYSTFLGGDGGDRGHTIAIDALGRAFVAGTSYSANFPTTRDSLKIAGQSSHADVFVTRLGPEGQSLEYSSLLGGSLSEEGLGIAIDGGGGVYVTGATRSPGFPTTVRAFDSTYNGNWDAFAAKIDLASGRTTYVVAGVVRDRVGNPAAGAIVSAGASGSTVADENGVFALIGLEPGTYTLTPFKAGHTFSPARRVINVPGDGALKTFVAVPGEAVPEPFLDLPLDYGDQALEMIRALRDTDDHGIITAWFDHDYPDALDAKNDRLTLWDGQPRTQQPYNQSLGCYEGRCYDSHNGIDFIYREVRPGLPLSKPLSVRAAADGRVVRVQAGCVVGDRWCGGGYGNYIVLDHLNGYFTLYAHLDQALVEAAQVLPRGAELGLMGSTGNSSNTHLHFSVFKDDGNGRWDGQAVDLSVDPFGWRGQEPDPWVIDRAGPPSHYLWRYDLSNRITFAELQGAHLQDPTRNIRVEIPPRAIPGQATLDVFLGPVPDPQNDLRSTGHSFWLQLSEWLPGPAVAPDGALPPGLLALAQPITVTVSLSQSQILHLDPQRLVLQRWDTADQTWRPLPTTVHSQTVTARASSLGQFDLQGPLLCAGDTLEPDDNYFSAHTISPDSTPQQRLFDLAADEDWFRFEAVAGQAYELKATALAAGLAARLTIYDLSRGVEVAAAVGTLNWRAEQDGLYYLRLQPDTDVVGCQAAYEVSLYTRDHLQHQLLLPLLWR